jgi:hypothetical protein
MNEFNQVTALLFHSLQSISVHCPIDGVKDRNGPILTFSEVVGKKASCGFQFNVPSLNMRCPLTLGAMITKGDWDENASWYSLASLSVELC